MVQRSETAGVQPSEQSPLLAKIADADGRGVSVSAAEVSAEGSPKGNGVNDSVSGVKADDEESQEQGEVEQTTGRAHVARIISVLLIGAS
jgi:hypothetical protein